MMHPEMITGIFDLFFSNLPERSLCRTVVGPATLRINSGLVHRVGRLLEAASHYDYQPYSVPKPGKKGGENTRLVRFSPLLYSQ